MNSTTIFGLLLLIISAFLVWRHLVVWRKVRESNVRGREWDFARRQYRRRIQTSAMIGFIGAAISGWSWVTDPMLFVFYVIGIVMASCWILALAVADAASSWAHFQGVYQRHKAEHAALRAQLEAEIRRRRGGGEDSGGRTEAAP